MTYRVFTEAHDIVDRRPRYETLESLVPVIKMEQVTNWEYVPVVEKQLGWSGGVVSPDGPLTLDAFDLPTVSASGTITITASGNVLVKAGMDATGTDSTITIESVTGDVTVGGAMPADPMIFDTLYLTAVQAIEITAAGDLLVGATATLRTTAESTDEPDITLTAGDGIEIAGQIEARHAVIVSAGTDILITGGIFAADSTIDVSAGNGAAGQGSIAIHRESEGTLTGVVKALSDDGEIILTAGTNLGNISLHDADIETVTLTLTAPAGTIDQPAPEVPDGEEPPSTGGLIAATSLTATAHAGITLGNTVLAQVSATVTGAGDILILNTGSALSSVGELLSRPVDVTLTNIEAANGAITLEVMARTLNVIRVASLTDADDHDISLAVLAADDDGAAVTLHDVQAAGAGDVELMVQGTITQPDGLLIADLATIRAFGAVSLRTQVDSLDIEIAGAGDLIVNNSSAAALILQNIEVANGNIHVTTPALSPPSTWLS